MTHDLVATAALFKLVVNCSKNVLFFINACISCTFTKIHTRHFPKM